ncbi:MAG: ribosome-associated translation inhibitor RaiA [Pseudomonadota bacterium]|nr:ribosome-associated translation inhibitor RaiA [Gammaproteobacteria bacterium]MBU1558947.1 ribosome-associated translation inhibitor RaiA [Gammaproteobacteria bacterium]MBU1629100.1 ribosome-associated translation inhibitor RaiA [Gammaproteobacteria bacterium]MBU2545679.1 ribosome-associated translation inhibitor RaiA [Gammaproteobacteria bacterium]
MQINFTGHGIEVTDALHNLIEKKFQKIIRHYKNVITSINVVLNVQKLTHVAEAIVHIKGAEIVANASDENMYKAIDQMILKLDKQLIKHRDKETNHRD